MTPLLIGCIVTVGKAEITSTVYAVGEGSMLKTDDQ